MLPLFSAHKSLGPSPLDYWVNGFTFLFHLAIALVIALVIAFLFYLTIALVIALAIAFLFHLIIALAITFPLYLAITFVLFARIPVYLLVYS